MAFTRASGWAGVARFGGVGDNLIAASPLAGLKRKGLKVEVLTNEHFYHVFEHNPNIDKLSVRSNRELPTDLEGWQRWFEGRADEYDSFAHLSHSCELSLAYFPSQTQFYWPAHVRRKLSDHNYLEFVHDIAGVPYEFGSLFYPTPDEFSVADDTLRRQIGGSRPVIAWAISGTRIDKIYPYAPMAIGRLIQELDVHVVMLGGGQKNLDQAKVIHEHVTRQNGSDRGLHLALSVGREQDKPAWPIRRSLTFAQCCDLVIGPDTGIMWSVAFEPVPKIMLISHASPKNITHHWANTVTLSADQERVPCWPCHQLHNEPRTCRQNRENNGAACISDISVETIVRTAEKLLENSDGQYRGIRREGNVGLGFGRSNTDETGNPGGRLVPRCADVRIRLGDDDGSGVRATNGDLRSSSIPRGVSY